MAGKEEKQGGESVERRPVGAKEYDRITVFLSQLQAEGGEVWPLTSERVRMLIGDDAYVTLVNYERAEAGQEAMDPAAALGERPKLLDRKKFD